MFVVLSDLRLLSSAILSISLAVSTSAITLAQETRALAQPQGVEIHHHKQASDLPKSLLIRNKKPQYLTLKLK
jgi:hypothetical protein